MPTIAECGGFLYLQKELEDAEGQVWEMTGVLDGSGFRTNRLQRFGYAVMTAKENSMLFEKGESIPVHEFHYWDCLQTGTAFEMKKPVGNKTWEGSVAGSSLYAGFPHLYFLAEPRLAERFARAFKHETGLTPTQFRRQDRSKNRRNLEVSEDGLEQLINS